MDGRAEPGSGSTSLPDFLREVRDDLSRQCARWGLGNPASGAWFDWLVGELAEGGEPAPASADGMSIEDWAAVRSLILEQLELRGRSVSLAELRALDRAVDARMVAAARAPTPVPRGRSGGARVREALRRLRGDEARFRRIVDANLIGIVFWTLEGGITGANEAFLRMLGLGRDELTAGRLDWKSLTPPEWAPVDAAMVESLRRYGKHPPYEKEYFARDGSRVPVLVGSTAFPDAPDQGVAFVLDLRERKAAERRLAERERQLRRVLAAAPWPVMVHDRLGRILLVNRAWLDGAGVGPDEVPDVEAWLRRAHGDAWRGPADRLGRLFAGGDPEPVELDVRTPGGVRRWSLASSLFGDFEGEAAIVTMAVDITERRRAEEELRRHVKLTRAIVDNTASALFLVDRDGRPTAMNPAAEAITGYTLAEMAGRPLHESIHHHRPDGRPYPVEECPMTGTLRAGVRHRALEETFLRRDGSFFPVEYSTTPLVEDGEVVGSVFEIRDISARRLAEQALQRREEELTRIFTASPDLLAVAGFDGYFRRTNPAFERLLGYSTEELRSRPLFEFVHPDDRASTRAEIERIAAGADTHRFVNRYLVRDGGVRWVSWNASPVQGAPQFVGVGRDVTDERARSEFERQLVGIVSHDLKNPLSAIQLSAALLLRRGGDLDEATRRTVDRIRSSADSALRLTGDLLDFTRARLGSGIPVRPAPADLHALVARAVEEVETAFPGRRIRVERSGPGAGEWDPGRLSQVITNLVVNALKHGTADGDVTVRSWGDDAGVGIEVRNGGEPIPPEELPHLFEPLRRGAGAGVRGGVGLGLFIVDRLVRAHGGRVSATSSREQGTAFVVRLPRQASPPEPTAD